MSDPARTRTLVLMRADVAPLNWHRPWSALVADAEAGVDGIALGSQPIVSGLPSFKWTAKVGDQGVTMWAAPPGWAAYYLSPDHKPDTAALHFQHYNTLGEGA